MSFRDYLRQELDKKSAFVLARGLQEMHDAPDQQKPALSKEDVERILAQYTKEEDPDMTHTDAAFFGDNPAGKSRIQTYAPSVEVEKETEELGEATMVPSKKEAAVAFATSHYNKKHGTSFSKHDVHGYLYGNQASDEFHDHVAANHNVEEPSHIKDAFGIPHDHSALNESEEHPQELDMDDHEQLHQHVHNAISSGYDLEVELADGSVVYIEPHQLQHFKNKNAIPGLFGSLGSSADFQAYLDSVYSKEEPTASHGPDPDPYKDVVPSPDKAMQVHDVPDPVMEAALTKLGRQKQLASVEPGESISVTVPKRGMITGRVKAIKGDKTIIVDQEGKEHEVETQK